MGLDICPVGFGEYILCKYLSLQMGITKSEKANPAIAMGYGNENAILSTNKTQPRHCIYLHSRYINTETEIDMSISAAKPKKLDHLPLVYSPIIFLLFEMCKITPIKTGDIIP